MVKVRDLNFHIPSQLITSNIVKLRVAIKSMLETLSQIPKETSEQLNMIVSGKQILEVRQGPLFFVINHVIFIFLTYIHILL